jgi:tRNA(Ile)-lysidine synthase
VPAADEPVSAAEAALRFSDLAQCPALVLAVSGGPDSTALLVLAARWRAGLEQGPRLLAVTVDHGLRPGSAAEARQVKRIAGKVGVEHRTVRWTGRKPSTGVQAAARSARYRLLVGAARKAGARHILTAHTRDDQAETILFRLARGSGIAGLAGMARTASVPHGGDPDLMLVRPFLDLPKSRLIATLTAAAIPFVEDPSNADPRFARARLRTIMPALAAEGLDSEKLAVLARRAARAEAAIEAAVTEALGRVSLTQWSKSGPIMLDGRALQGLPSEVVLRLVGRAIAAVGDEGPVELAKLEALLDAIGEGWTRGSSRYGRFRRTLAGALVTVDDERLRIERAPARRRRL